MSQENLQSTYEQAADAVDRMPDADPKADSKKTESTAVARPSDLLVRDGLIVPQTLSESTRVAKGLLESGCLPRSLDSLPKVLMAQQFLRQLGLPDIAALPRVAVINGSYSLWGEGPKAICQPQIEDFEEFWFDAEYKKICFDNHNLKAEVYGALCWVKRKGIRTGVERVFTVDDAKTAGLWNGKDTWKKYPNRMLQMRTRSWALKDAFPDMLMGFAIAEYDHHTIVEGGQAESESKAATLVAKFQD